MIGTASSGHVTRGNSNMMLLLSLNLILLAFFILLNSLADFETERARAVLASVKQAFNGKVEAAGQLPSLSSSLGALPEVEAKMREVGSLFEAIAPSAQAKSVRRANSVQIDFPASVLFRPGSQRLRQGREALLERFAESLRKGPEGAPRYLLEILVGTGSQTVVDGGAPTASASLELRRAAVLAARLSAQGAPLDGLSTGLRPGAADSLRFVVRLRPDSGAATGSGGGEG
jgi:outer membrane protein OmpA-like peptidoglycan-associated protein